MSDIFDFHFFNDQLASLGAVNSAAEVQGFLCGKLSGGQELSADQWCEESVGFMDLEHITLSEDQRALIEKLLELSRSQLTDPDFSFTPLLPGDESPIEQRVRELASWCEGYLHGVGSSGIQGADKLSADVADAFRDLAKISQATVDQEDMDEDDSEGYWVELEEYVKVAVLTVYNELNPPASNDNDETVH